jgi:hypothetical protein
LIRAGLRRRGGRAAVWGSAWGNKTRYGSPSRTRRSTIRPRSFSLHKLVTGRTSTPEIGGVPWPALVTEMLCRGRPRGAGGQDAPRPEHRQHAEDAVISPCLPALS